MRKYPVIFTILLVAILESRAQELTDNWFCASSSEDGTVQWVVTPLGKQKIVSVQSQEIGANPTLVVFLHADSPFGDPVYQYDIARSIATNLKNSVVIAPLRPGYGDSCGDRSAGDAGRKMGDNYTADVVESLAKILTAKQESISPRQTIVMGHSGGAALSALLGARYPDLADRLVLVACPCDLPRWRESMRVLSDNPRWTEEMPGLSPVDEIGKLSADVPIELWVGDQDVVTPPGLSIHFASRVSNAGKQASYTVISGGGHDMILRPDILLVILRQLSN